MLLKNDQANRFLFVLIFFETHIEKNGVSNLIQAAKNIMEDEDWEQYQKLMHLNRAK